MLFTHLGTPTWLHIVPCLVLFEPHFRARSRPTPRRTPALVTGFRKQQLVVLTSRLLAPPFLVRSQREFASQIPSHAASTFANLSASLCPASLKPFRYFFNHFRNFPLSPNFATPSYLSSLYVIFFYFSSLFVNPFYVFPYYSQFPIPPLYYNFTQKFTSSPSSQTL